MGGSGRGLSSNDETPLFGPSFRVVASSGKLAQGHLVVSESLRRLSDYSVLQIAEVRYFAFVFLFLAAKSALYLFF